MNDTNIIEKSSVIHVYTYDKNVSKKDYIDINYVKNEGVLLIESENDKGKRDKLYEEYIDMDNISFNINGNNIDIGMVVSDITFGSNSIKNIHVEHHISDKYYSINIDY